MDSPRPHIGPQAPQTPGQRSSAEESHRGLFGRPTAERVGQRRRSSALIPPWHAAEADGAPGAGSDADAGVANPGADPAGADANTGADAAPAGARRVGALPASADPAAGFGAGFGPPPRSVGRRVRDGVRGRPLRAALTGTIVLLLVGCTAAGALLLHGRNTLQQTPIEGISTTKGRMVVLPDGERMQIMNVLLVGSDDRDTLSPEERSTVAPDRFTGRRPDTLMLAQVQVGGGGAAALLSFPRDLRVELCDGTLDKINASFIVGKRSGIDPESCLVQTVTGLTGVAIDHYVEVDFAGFLRVIDALGGVTMYLDEPMIDTKAHLRVPAGCVTLSPEQALGFVRSRGYDDDFGRIARQQRFVKETLEEITRVGVLANPPRLFSIVDRVARAVRTDDGLGLTEMRSLALGLRSLTSDRVIAHTVPGRNATVDGIAYVEQDHDEAEQLYASFRDGSVLRPLEERIAAEPEPTVTPEPRTPADAPPIAILNATGHQGLAARTAELLETAGFRITGVGNAEHPGLARTEVIHGTGLEEDARLVAGTLGGAEVLHESGGAPLTVVLGEDLDEQRVEELIAGLSPPEPDPAQEEPAEEPAEPTTGPTADPTPEPQRTFRGAASPDVSC